MNADADESGELDFDEFCDLVRELEEGEHGVAELRARFDELDTNRNGTNPALAVALTLTSSTSPEAVVGRQTGSLPCCSPPHDAPNRSSSPLPNPG